MLVAPPLPASHTCQGRQVIRQRTVVARKWLVAQRHHSTVGSLDQTAGTNKSMSACIRNRGSSVYSGPSENFEKQIVDLFGLKLAGNRGQLGSKPAEPFGVPVDVAINPLGQSGGMGRRDKAWPPAK